MAALQSPRRLGYLILAYGCVGFGALGTLVPLLPTTPFLLVAGWAAMRSSPKLRWWLYRHPRYGLSLRAWQRHRAIPASAKLTGCFLLALSWVTLWLLGLNMIALSGLTAFFLLIAGFILTRPSSSDSATHTAATCNLKQ